MSEYSGKNFLKKVGIPVPEGRLAGSVEEAVLAAEQIGYPVVLKAHAHNLAHKSDIGGVIVGIANEAELKQAWTSLHQRVSLAKPDLVLEGILVEKMGAKGIEMVVGAKRDGQWGPVVIVGLGGIWIEIFKDVLMLPPDLGEEEIAKQIDDLKSAELLRGARGSQPADVQALAKVVAIVGGLMRSTPNLKEIDLNPVLVYPEGEGVLAVDVLIIGADEK